MLNEIPSWLRSLRVTVSTDSKTMLFDSWTDNIQELKFDDLIGGQSGTTIKVGKDLYIIDGIQIITDMTTDISDIIKEKYLFQVVNGK